MSYLQSKLPDFSPAVVVEPWRKALMDAAEYIRVHGWCQGQFAKLSGQVCVLTAMSRVSDRALFEANVDRLADRTGCFSVIAWNDNGKRTADDVIRALEECARS